MLKLYKPEVYLLDYNQVTAVTATTKIVRFIVTHIYIDIYVHANISKMVFSYKLQMMKHPMKEVVLVILIYGRARKVMGTYRNKKNKEIEKKNSPIVDRRTCRQIWGSISLNVWNVRTQTQVCWVQAQEGGTLGIPCRCSSPMTLSVEGGFRPRGRGSHGFDKASPIAASMLSFEG